MSINLNSITGIPGFEQKDGEGGVTQSILQIGIIFIIIYLVYNSLGNNKLGWNLQTLAGGVMLILLVMFLLYRYAKTDGMNKFGNPSPMWIVFLVAILFFILFQSLGKNGSSEYDEYGEEIYAEDNGNSKYLGIATVSIFFVLLLTSGFTYFFKFDVVTSVKNLFTKAPEIDFTVKGLGDDSKKIERAQQVYNIPDNKYTYHDAKAVCKAYGGRLANYKDMRKAYERGANWCSYGWSENQAALYPTQYDTWEKLQKIKGRENDCGRPGINGGFIGNKNAKFGVNCYGYKPKINQLESQLMQELQKTPSSDEEKDFNKDVKHWRSKIKDILIAPFNNTNWSMV